MLNNAARKLLESEVREIQWKIERVELNLWHLRMQADILQGGLDNPQIQSLYDDGWQVPSENGSDDEQRS